MTDQPHHEAAKAVLWCCHVRGPDDVHAAPDYETALKWADYMNDTFLMHQAVPAPWPWSASSHAEELPKSIANFAVPGAAEK